MATHTILNRATQAEILSLVLYLRRQFLDHAGWYRGYLLTSSQDNYSWEFSHLVPSLPLLPLPKHSTPIEEMLAVGLRYSIEWILPSPPKFE
jgi:hypothetical protein